MEIKTYAPVIIPTLNRYDHFRQCLESLEKCTGADKTEVYVGLDYPPLDESGKPMQKYAEGWKKIDTFLQEKEKQNGFKKLVVFRRDHNCGIMGAGSNINQLGKFARERYDRYIASEDDNIFSPNFLEYINKGLEMFKDDPTVLAINGYSHPYHFKFDGNNYFRHNVDFAAWGFGIWNDRVGQYTREICEEEIFRKTFSWKGIRKVKKIGYNRLLGYIGDCLQPTMKNAWLIDSVLTEYMVIKDMHVIMPAVSKVRNIGWDNSGQSFEKKGITEEQKIKGERHRTQVIDTNISFEYEGDPMKFFEENTRAAVAESDGRISLFTFLKRLSILVPKMMAKRLLWPWLKNIKR